MASRQCEFCFKRILSRKGAYAKHIRSCSSQQLTTHDNSTENRNRALNPLLSNFCTKTQLSDDEFNINGFSDSFLEDDYNTDESSYGKKMDINSITTDNSIITSSERSGSRNSWSRRNPANLRFEIMLFQLIMTHRASLAMFDDICKLVDEYTSSPDFSVLSKLSRRKSVIRSLEYSLKTTALRPKQVTVTLHDQSQVTVPVFDTKAMILDILTDSSLMNESNFAEGYDVLTGAVDPNNPHNSKYGEVHTGDAWEPAKSRYCHPNDTGLPSMPVALIVFGDKSHTDLHGTLALTPVIFTLTLFNRAARNNTKFWRPMGYIPNLSAQKGVADKRLTRDKLQDEHTCLAAIFKSLCNINREGGFNLFIFGREVRVKVWIHYFIGDTEGNNKWLGQYPGNREGVQRPYRDCKCSFDKLELSNPRCQYIRLEDIREGRKRKRDDDDGGVSFFKSISRYDIRNALLHPHLPLSDNIHGPFKMMPPELLHTSGSGLIMYMFASLRDQLGAGKGRDIIDQQHLLVSKIIQHQSERDFPRGSTRNGLIDGTKCQSSERKGNLFRLLIIACRTTGRKILQDGLRLNDDQWKQFIFFLKMYLAMEEWFHDENDKVKVNNARPTIATVLTLMKKYFPRNGEHTNGYNLPKMHGATKMQTYIKLLGSGLNFFGGPGEAAHKIFVKASGQKTQRRLSEFAQQTSTQYYYMILSLRAAEKLNKNYSKKDNNIASDTDNDDVQIELSGRYDLILTREIIEEMHQERTVRVKWHTNDNEKKCNQNYRLHPALVKCLHRHITKCKDNVSKVTGYTRAIITNPDTRERNIFYCHPSYQGREWYDWALVQFVESDGNNSYIEKMYPSKILGFININGNDEAVIQCANKHLCWDDLIKHFIIPITIGCQFDVSFVVVPIESIVHPLCSISVDEENNNRFLVVLPKRNWSAYFGKHIKV